MVASLLVALGLAGLRIAQLSLTIAQLTAQIDHLQTQAAREHETLITAIQAQRDRHDPPTDPLDLPDGYVTEVHPERQEVVVSIGHAQGARAPLRMAIFAAHTPTIPVARWKAQIELTEVGGQTSIARVNRMDDTEEPIRVGDIVYSPAWSPNLPTRYALIGTIDSDRDNKDDRDELKRATRAAGGVVDFDLPPPEAGAESGTLSPFIDWYIVDDRAAQSPQLAQRTTTAIKQARYDGIRPMPLARLRALLGHDTGPPRPVGSPGPDR
jgi:hypothetical protein